MKIEKSLIHPNRRGLLKAAAGLGGLAVYGSLPMPAIAQAKRKVTLAYGVPTLDSVTSAFFSSIPIGLGYYAEEGLDVEVHPMNGASAAITVLASGGAQFSTHSSGALLPAIERGVPIKSFIVQIPDSFSSIAVEETSSVTKVEDLKNKTIGVAALTGAPTVLIKSVLAKLGWDLKKDVEFLAVGTGIPALDALRRNRIQALGLWMSPYAVFETLGAKFRYFRPEPLPSVGFTHTTNTTNEMLEKDPDLVARMSRALAKSLAFTVNASPDEITRLHFKVYPSVKPLGRPEDELLRMQRAVTEATLKYMRVKQRFVDRSEKIGDETDQRISELAHVLRDGGEMSTVQTPDHYFTRQFIDEMNKIDVDAITAQARAFRA